MRRRLHDPSFDLLGNATLTLPRRPQGAWAGNRLLVHQDMRFAWDRHGNLAIKQTGKHTRQRFAYDAQMQLVEVTTERMLHTSSPSVQTVRFDYDALGRRVAKHTEATKPLLHAVDETARTASQPTTKPSHPQRIEFIWEGNRLLQERLTSTVTASAEGPAQQVRAAHTRTYVWEPDRFIPLARIDGTAQILSKSELSARATKSLDAKNAYGLDVSDDDDDLNNFTKIKQALAAPPTLVQLQAMGEQAQQLQHAIDTGQNKAADNTTTRILHYHCDHLGTPQELTDEDGKLVWSANYAAWGKIKSVQGRPSPDGSNPPPPGQFWHTRTQPR